MRKQFVEVTKQEMQSNRYRMLTKLAVAHVALAMIYFGLMSAAEAQTSVVCDPAGDSVFGNGKGGPQVPAWLDITRATITNVDDSLLFTLRVNAPIPLFPSWDTGDDFGQFWWSWRMVNDVDAIGFVSNGCLQAKGQTVPACYCLDLIWNVQAASFRVRLLDDTLCTETSLPFAFSPDRREFSILVPKALFTNPALVQNPNAFQFLAEIIIWKESSNGNTALTIVDNAPSQGNGPFILGSWSSSNNTSFGCQ